MRRTMRWLFSMAAVLAMTASMGAQDAHARTSFSVGASSGSFSVSYFYDELDDYGTWVDYGGYGSCWVPARVDRGWRPYSHGHWYYTDYGWTWASYEPWGWATYHYGRWVLDPHYGWVWVPGTVWAPAWVAWRESHDHIGWAPLGPDVGWSVSVGLTFGSSHYARIPNSNWCFVDRHRFDSRDVRTVVYKADRNDDVFRRTRDATRFRSRNGSPFNEGLPVAKVERSMGRRIERTRVATVDSPDRVRSRARNNLRVEQNPFRNFERQPQGRSERAQRDVRQERATRTVEQQRKVRAQREVRQERASRTTEQNPFRNFERQRQNRTERAQREVRAERGQDQELRTQERERSRESDNRGNRRGGNRGKDRGDN